MRELLWNSRTQRVEIRFPFDRRIVGVLREIPGRRWHPEEKSWSVPREAVREVTRRLLPHGFTASEEIRALLDAPELPSAAEESAPPADDEGAELPAPLGVAVAEPRAEETWTVSSLNERVRALLRDRLPFPFWVVGEVIGFDRNAHKSHVFFTLAEKEEGDDAPRATATAVLFAPVRPRIEATLAHAGGSIVLGDGVRVRLRVRVDLYPRTGSYQLVVEEIDPTFTLGEIALRRERILREVRAAGLAERNLALPFPVPPLRIALVTSLGSDAYNDFLNELARSGYAFVVAVADVHVQGEKLEPEVLAALERFARDADRHDVLVITRGGGARTDLMGFDTASLAFAVARHPLKAIIGIGHQQDRSVLDEIAHSEKTPTAAAARLVALCAEAEEVLYRGAERLARALARTVAGERSRDLLRRLRLTRRARETISGERATIARRRDALGRGGRRALRSGRELLERRGLRVAAGLAGRLAAARARLGRDREGLPRAADRALARARERIAGAGRELARRPPPRLRESAARLAHLAEAVAARDPRRILARGYAWLRRPDGASVRDVMGVRPGDPILARLRDGSLRARVETVELEERPSGPTGAARPSAGPAETT